MPDVDGEVRGQLRVALGVEGEVAQHRGEAAAVVHDGGEPCPARAEPAAELPPAP